MDGIADAQELQVRLDGGFFLDDLADRLFPSLASGVRWGLERTEKALKSLGDPHRSYRTIHVGGTNGKGSVTSTLAAVLETAGFRTGCYTSPHLCSFRERIRVAGNPLTQDRTLGLAEELMNVPEICGLTFFEAATVLGLYAFEREDVEVAVIEVGLGGRLDATNVISPEITAITNVALDHSDYLGNSLIGIAREKLGIVKPGIPLVTTEPDKGLLEIFREVTRDVGSPCLKATEPAPDRIGVSPDRTRFTLETNAWGQIEIETPLVGRHQATNAALAVEMLQHMPEDLRPELEILRAGIATVEHHGRNQIEVIDGRVWFFDVAHNVAGMDSLIDTIDSLDLPRPLVALVGVLGDKDWRSMLSPLLSRMDSALLTQPPSAPLGRCWKPEDAFQTLKKIAQLRIEEDFEQALIQARSDAGQGTVLVTGSVHTVGSALKILKREPLRGESC